MANRPAIDATLVPSASETSGRSIRNRLSRARRSSTAINESIPISESGRSGSIPLAGSRKIVAASSAMTVLSRASAASGSRPAICSLSDSSDDDAEPLVRASENSGLARIGRKRRPSFQLVSAKATTGNPLAIIAGSPASASDAEVGFAPSRRASASRVSGRSAK